MTTIPARFVTEFAPQSVFCSMPRQAASFLDHVFGGYAVLVTTDVRENIVNILVTFSYHTLVIYHVGVGHDQNKRESNEANACQRIQSMNHKIEEFITLREVFSILNHQPILLTTPGGSLGYLASRETLQ